MGVEVDVTYEFSSQIQIKFDPQRDCYNYYNLKNEKLYGDRCAQDQKCCGTCYYRYCCKEEYASSKVNQLLCTNNDVEGTYATEMPPIINVPGLLAAVLVIVPLLVTGIVILVCYKKKVFCFKGRKYQPPGAPVETVHKEKEPLPEDDDDEDAHAKAHLKREEDSTV
ncbi:protein shisa-4-like [Lingula anatina]|uniref:Protein shisa-4-like n=1 Tax=Lingula anatina TaxID=7574 RepID=A0A1S3J9L6_LINAN|nr:protein shisa-4-like [Lingula anatina]|eukprot:XP_013407013.1 protein shisa-4-like [Lingula anatina]